MFTIFTNLITYNIIQARAETPKRQESSKSNQLPPISTLSSTPPTVVDEITALIDSRLGPGTYPTAASQLTFNPNPKVSVLTQQNAYEDVRGFDSPRDTSIQNPSQCISVTSSPSTNMQLTQLAAAVNNIAVPQRSSQNKFNFEFKTVLYFLERIQEEYQLNSLLARLEAFKNIFGKEANYLFKAFELFKEIFEEFDWGRNKNILNQNYLNKIFIGAGEPDLGIVDEKIYTEANSTVRSEIMSWIKSEINEIHTELQNNNEQNHQAFLDALESLSFHLTKKLAVFLIKNCNTSMPSEGYTPEEYIICKLPGFLERTSDLLNEIKYHSRRHQSHNSLFDTEDIDKFLIDEEDS